MDALLSSRVEEKATYGLARWSILDTPSTAPISYPRSIKSSTRTADNKHKHHLIPLYPTIQTRADPPRWSKNDAALGFGGAPSLCKEVSVP